MTIVLLLEELGRTPTQSEVFTRAHTKKKDRSHWVDKCARSGYKLGRLICGSRSLWSTWNSHSRQRSTDRRFMLCASSMPLRSHAYRALLIPVSGVRSGEEHRVSDVQFHAEHAGRLNGFKRRNAISDASSTAA
ncbi:hypothetical protein PIB30_011119 [Stylosanthes scabra]|uniref:Uncharacterized protein n=1 Tax=Stylosanthes scabra TaxID=79078 RepID=A0ABU6Z5D0_9FABA|nr:hypothetical protein [Stylosanthes scabra]